MVAWRAAWVVAATELGLNGTAQRGVARTTLVVATTIVTTARTGAGTQYDVGGPGRG